jgi:hypothetical protein
MTAQIKLKHSGGNGVIIEAPASNPASDKTIALPSSESGVFATKDSANSLQNVTGINGGQLANRNMVINGGMMINQRYEDAAHTPTDGIYTMDRWQAWMSTTGKFSVTRSDDHPDDFAKSLLVTSLSAATVTANHEHGITTKIEAQNMSQLAFGTSSAKSATLSFFVKCSLTGTFGGLVANAALNMSYVFSYTVNSANTWERKTITIPPTTSGSFASGVSNGLQVHFEFGVGSNRTAAVGWQTNAAVRGVNSQVNLVATNAATWRMTGLQLEVGTTATEFEHKSYGQELALCQRYYQTGFIKIYDSNAGNQAISQNFMPEMRAAPTITGEQFESQTNAPWGSIEVTTKRAASFFKNGVEICQRWICSAEL